MKPPRIRTVAWIMFGLVVANAAGVGLFGALRVLPAVAPLGEATMSLRRLYGRLSEDGRWLATAHSAATRAVIARDASAARQVRASLSNRDRLVGELPLADVPRSVRVPIARAEDLAARLVVLYDETVSLLELDRRTEARQRLAIADTLMERFTAILAEVQVRGLDDVIEGESRVRAVGDRLLLTYLVWLSGTVLLLVLGLLVLVYRVIGPMRALRRGLERVEQGELSVTLEIKAPDEIGELAEHFNRMTAVLRDRAEKQGRVAAAGELLAGAAHEVNNPLMAITGLAETRLAEPGLPAAVRADLESVAGEAHRAGQLLKGIIRFARPVEGEPRPFDLNDIARDAWDLVWFQLKADGVQGRLELVPGRLPVVAVPQKVEQALINLLSNAHQAVTRRGPPRKIVVRTLVEDGQAVALASDNGPGVADDFLDKLFRPFRSAESAGRAGLGLYTSRLLLREFRGDVTHRPSTDAGATFAVSLPLASADLLAKPRVEQPSGPRRALNGLSILVVDDEPTVRRPISRFLTKRGASVREAGDGREALVAVSEQETDVVVTDLRMPTMDGVAFYKELLSRRPSLAARVIFLSGDIAQLDQLGGAEIDPARVIAKPIELAELEQRIIGQLT